MSKAAGLSSASRSNILERMSIVSSRFLDEVFPVSQSIASALPMPKDTRSGTLSGICTRLQIGFVGYLIKKELHEWPQESALVVDYSRKICRNGCMYSSN